MYNYILFDMDGTIIDSSEGLFESFQYTLNHYGIELKHEDLGRLIGPPLTVSFPEFYGFDKEKTAEAVRIYRKHYEKDGIWKVKMYKDIDNLAKALKDQGKKVAVATSKPEKFASQLIEHLGLAPYFDVVSGAPIDEKDCTKADVIRNALKALGCEDLSKAVIVGDRKYDILGANEVGIDSIGILFGFGDEAELKKAGATYIAKTAMEVLKYT